MEQTTVSPRETVPSTNGSAANGSAANGGPVWQVLSVDEALRQQGTDAAQGLSATEVESRMKQYGPNSFAQAKKVPGWLKFARQYKDTMQIVLVVAAAVSGLVVHQWGTALLLLALTVFNAMLGMHQEG